MDAHARPLKLVSAWRNPSYNCARRRLCIVAGLFSCRRGGCYSRGRQAQSQRSGKLMITVPKRERLVAGRRMPLAGLSAVLALITATASGQLTDVAATSLSTPATLLPAARTDREAEYASLARDVEALGRELGLVKRVVKLITPAVVHIESKVAPRFQGSLRIEEAGSGVVVQLGSRYCVLTNRHVIRHSTPRAHRNSSGGRPRAASDSDLARQRNRCRRDVD